MPEYKCDRCNKVHELKQEKIIEMEYYVAPYSCYSGDYYTHDHYFFYCDCNRPIEVKKQDINDLYSLPKIDKNHGGGRCILNTYT